MKNLTLFNLLFAAFLILKIAAVQPFAAWSWFYVAAPLIAGWVFGFIARFVEKTGFVQSFWGEIELLKYEILLKRETNKFKKQLKNGTKK